MSSKTDIEVIMAKLLNMDIVKESYNIPRSLEEFKSQLAQAEGNNDCEKIKRLKESSDRVSSDPELAFTLAVKALNRCLQKQQDNQ